MKPQYCQKVKFISTKVSQHGTLVAGQGECYATTSMRKVELELEFIFLSGSAFLSRLRQQVISVPFVV